MSKRNPLQNLSDDELVHLAKEAGRGVERSTGPEAPIVEMIRRHHDSLVKANAVQTRLTYSVIALTVVIIVLMFVQIAVALLAAWGPCQ